MALFKILKGINHMAKLTAPEVSKEAFESWYKSGDSVEKNLGGITGFQAKWQDPSIIDT